MEEQKSENTYDEQDVIQESKHTKSDPVEESEATDKKMQSILKNKIFAPVIAAVLLLVGGFVFLSGGDSTNEQEQEVVSLASAVSLVEGDVQVSSDGEEWMDATGGETVSVGMYIRTLGDSRTVLLHDDGSAIRLDENTQVMLSVSDNNSVEVMLVSGQVYSRVVESETRTYAVVTDRERFEALGTAFKTATDRESDKLEVYESSVMVNSEKATIEEGNKYDTKTKKTSDIDLKTLKDDEFVQWNKDQDSQDEEFRKKLGILNKEVKEKPETVAPVPVSPDASITLRGSATDDGVSLSWDLNGTTSTDGFKIAYSKDDSTPSYGENTAQYVSNGSARSKVVVLTDGKTYFLRICIYRAASGTCDTYSNAVQVKVPVKEVKKVQSGTIELSINEGVLSWALVGGNAPHGFKVVMNSKGTPSYPANSIAYVGANTFELPEKPTGTYKVRVCKYTADGNVSGGCTDYSNEVTYVVVSE